MKTNLKRVISIILGLAMMISLVTALGGVALAAPPVLSKPVASISGDLVTVKTVLSEVDASKFASLRALDKDTGGYVYLNQYTLEVGENSRAFPVSAVALKGKVLKIIIAAGVGNGTQTAWLAIGVDKDALEDAIDAAPGFDKEALYSAVSWAVFGPALEEAIDVFEDETASQLEVDAACDALVDATAALQLLITSLKIKADPMVSVKRGDTGLTFALETNEGAYTGGVTWAISNPAYATVTVDGVVTILNKTGTVILTATDSLTKLTFSIVLRIS